MDIKELIKWSLQRWWWYIISIAICGVIGGICYMTTIPQFKVEAVLMLRQSEASNQNEMLRMMGFGDSKVVGDEVRVLMSRDLMGRVVDSLNLCTTYSVKDKRYWIEQYPSHDLTAQLVEPTLQTVEITLKVGKKGYNLKVKRGYKSEHYSLVSLDAPVHTFVGDMHLNMCDSVTDGTYKARIQPRMRAIEQNVKSISIKLLDEESNVIILSATTACPARSIATINTLLDLYNQTMVMDKNRLAVQTEQFLASRIELIGAELNQAESELEMFKRKHQIANLEASAANYQKTGESYQIQVAELDAQLQILDFMAETLPSYEKTYNLIPGNMGITDPTLADEIQEYNELVARRNNLLQTATEQNVVVELLTQQIDQRKDNINTSLNQLRGTLNRRRQFIQEQQNQYDSRLASIPETERRYLEMNRAKQTKEKQYLYLIEKREENAMLLSAEAVPAKVVDRAQQNPDRLSPKLSSTGVAVLFFGVLLPVLLYLIGVLRKELL